jgi:signal transduction histidine kinase
MVAHLLSFAQQNVACPVVVDLATELPRIATRVADIIGDMLTLEVIIDEAKTSYCVEIDVDEFDMAMLNLILNARDALPHGGEITLALGAAESPSTIQSPLGAIGLSVRDAGAGMKPEVVQRAFEPFFTTKDVGRGSGLGLSQVLGFARQSGGHVSIVSAPGSGTSVTIILPRCPLGTKPTAAVEDEPPNGRKNETTSRRRSTS